jgi:transposase
MNVTTFGLDIAKNVMQVHWVDGQTGEVGRRALKRSQLAPFFARQAQCRIVLEACGSSHYWGRTLSALGHEVRLIHARHIRPYVRGNKNDAADAQAIWSAAQQPEMRWVPIKSEQQQAVLSLHRVRAQWIKVRTQTTNGLRGLLYEFGVLLPGGRQAGVKALGASRAEIDAKVPVLMHGLIDGQLQMLRQIDERIAAIEGELQGLEHQLDSARRVRPIPGGYGLGGRAGRGCQGLSQWPGVCRVPGPGALPPGHRWQGRRGALEQARRSIPANAADARGARRDLPCEEQKHVVGKTAGAPTAERGGGSAGQQDSTHGLGAGDPWA